MSKSNARLLTSLLVANIALIWSCGRTTVVPTARDPGEATYRVEHEVVSLVRGRSEREAAPGSEEIVVTSVNGEPASGDLNGDGVPDAAVWLLRQPGGTGSFFYVAVALDVSGRYVGSNAVFVGDRIEPGALTIRDGILSVRYADRRPGEPMTASPSVSRIRYLKISGADLIDID